MDLLYFIYMIIVLLLMPVLAREGGIVCKIAYLVIDLGIPFLGIYLWWRERR